MRGRTCCSTTTAATQTNAGSIRIPIDQAMKLIAERGLPMSQAPASGEQAMVGDATPQITAPLTDGFARTGYELDVMEERRAEG